ncbi:hypothetical protein E4T43_05847 [Aureobasidium subglaciale]|nr:hypothetical protein E4T43_05847 [Aureobasidium subglaciale]
MECRCSCNRLQLTFRNVWFEVSTAGSTTNNLHPQQRWSRPLTKKNVPIAKSIAYNKHIWFSLHHNVSMNASIQHPGRSRNVLLWSSWNRESATPDVLFADLFFSMVVTTRLVETPKFCCES